MKRRESFFLSFIILILVFSSFALLFKPVKSQALTVRVGAYENNPKIFSENGDGLFWVGFWPDVVRYIADMEGWNIQWVPGTWTECLTRLENNEIDIMVDVGYSAARSQLYDFNNVSVFSNWGVIYARAAGILLTFGDLEGMNVAVMNNSIHYTGEYGIKNLTALWNINCTFIVVDNYKQVFAKLDSGEADAGTVNRLFGLLNKDKYNVVPTSLIYNPVDLKFGFPQNASLNDELIDKIDYHLNVLQDDPNSIYYESINKYFLQMTVVETIPDWIIFMIISIVGLVLVFLVMSFYLKRRVNQKTLELLEKNMELKLMNQILIETIPNGVLFVYDTGEISIANQNFKNICLNAYNLKIRPNLNISSLPDNSLTSAINKVIRESEAKSSKQQFFSKKQTISLESQIHIELFASRISLEGDYHGYGYLFVITDVSPFVELENLRKQFISTVSHELRTPITAINLSLNNLVKYREKLSGDQKNKILAMVMKSGIILSDMIEDLLITSRIDAKKLRLVFIDCNIFAILDEMMQQFHVRIVEKELNLKFEVDRQASIKGDKKRISQIFRILIDNAIKYTPHSSEIKIQAINDYHGPYNPDNLPGIVVKVSDEGIGISEKDLPNLFKSFYRGSNVGSIGGTGLGLSIAKVLVDRHGGKIFVESQEGKGTTFIVFLPKKKKEIGDES